MIDLMMKIPHMINVSNAKVDYIEVIPKMMKGTKITPHNN